MDKFGQEIIMKGQTIVSLPRLYRCSVGYITTQMAIVDQRTSCIYTIKPYIARIHYNEEESLEITKKYIWYDCLEFGAAYKFIDSRHYPNIFRLNLVDQLHLRVPTNLELDNFILHVRNALFDKIIFSCCPHIVRAANNLNNGVLKIDKADAYIPLNPYKKKLKKNRD